MNIPDIEKILYATDLSENARHAFSYAVSLSNRYEASITLVHVLEELPPSTLSRLSDYLDEEQLGQIRRRNQESVLQTAREKLHKFCDESVPSCPPVEIVVKEGHAVEEILEMAHSGDHDIVVMGTHGRGFFAGAMMGNTARRVIRRCRIPVLVIRLPEDED